MFRKASKIVKSTETHPTDPAMAPRESFWGRECGPAGSCFPDPRGGIKCESSQFSQEVVPLGPCGIQPPSHIRSLLLPDPTSPWELSLPCSKLLPAAGILLPTLFFLLRLQPPPPPSPLPFLSRRLEKSPDTDLPEPSLSV